MEIILTPALSCIIDSAAARFPHCSRCNSSGREQADSHSRHMAESRASPSARASAIRTMFMHAVEIGIH
eukprot:6191235-Pleurochrysis_carterae.AAC.2